MPNVNLSEADVRDVIHFFFLLDNSGSMSGTAIQTLNEAMVNTMYELKTEVDRKEAKAMMHILAFNSSIKWLCGTTAVDGVPIEEITWTDISVAGSTDTASAIRSILPGLSRSLLGHHAYRPIIVLITDGYSDDRAETTAAIQELITKQKTINIAVGVNGYNAVELDDFASEGTIVRKDAIGNELGTSDGRFVFPIDRAQDMAKIISELAISSLKASILIRQEEEKGGEQNEGEKISVEVTEQGENDITVDSDDTGWI